MTDFFMDTDAGSDASDGTTWANAKLTLEGLLAVMSAGDVGFIQGATTDTAASSRTFTSPGIDTNPCNIIGVKDGTTNEPPVASDLTVRGTDTLPSIDCTGGGNDLTFAGSFKYIGLDFDAVDRLTHSGTDQSQEFLDCELDAPDLRVSPERSNVTHRNCEINTYLWLNSAESTNYRMLGGIYSSNNASRIFRAVSLVGSAEITGVDLSGSVSAVVMSNDDPTVWKFRNCKLKTGFSAIGTVSTNTSFSQEMIGCSDTTSQAADSSIQDYTYDDVYGSIVDEQTIVRTDGSTDDATGLFSYAMTPHANATLESSNATLKSPWMSVWVDASVSGLTVFIASDAAGDMNKDEAWFEFYFPDSGDTAQHEQFFDAGDARLLDSSDPITDDTGSTWASGGNNNQKFEASPSPGFEGWAYGRLHLAKRQASPDTVFLDMQLHTDTESANVVTRMNSHGVMVSFDPGSGGGGMIVHPGMTGNING